MCIYTHPITHLWWICDCYVCVYRLQTVSTNLNYLEYYALNCYRIFITERELIFYWIQHLYQDYQYIRCVEFELFIILYILAFASFVVRLLATASTLNFPRVTRSNNSNFYIIYRTLVSCSANGNDSTFFLPFCSCIICNFAYLWTLLDEFLLLVYIGFHNLTLT